MRHPFPDSGARKKQKKLKILNYVKGRKNSLPGFIYKFILKTLGGRPEIDSNPERKKLKTILS